MKKDELKRLTGFDSFLECFQWLKREKLDGKKYINCIKPAEEKLVFGKPFKVAEEKVALEISIIKDGALEELYKGLPTKDDKTKLNQSLGINLMGWQYEELNQIIDKIPTK